ncbi:MAG: ATP-binding cassette domain-containing protein [Planctomycetota bacterium]
MIEFIDVHKSFNSHEVLKGLSFKINRGESFAILGRSGCGKSVTLKLMTGLLKPDRGQIIIDGIDITKLENSGLAKIRKKFGFLFQSGALLNSLNIENNIALPLREHKELPEAAIMERVKEVLNILGLKHLEHVMPAELSGGMKKRVSLARAIIRRPEIILYDEPTTGLDPIMANVINHLIVDLRERLKITSVVVTHDMKSTFMVADRIILLYRGQIIRSGTPDEFKDSPDPFIKQFVLGEPKGPFQDEDELKLQEKLTGKKEENN